MKKVKSKTARKSKLKAKKPSTKSKRTIRQAADERDIVELILRDHKPLKKLIEGLKEEDAEISEIREAFEQFEPLLVAHAKSEERSLYVHMKEEEELRPQGYEGDTEHAIADQLVAEAKSANSEDEFRAKAKVLAELVEHHIDEEEKEMLKEVRKELDLEQRIQIGEEYQRLYSEFNVETQAA